MATRYSSITHLTIEDSALAQTFLDRSEVGGTGDAITLAPDPAIATLTNNLTFAYITEQANTVTAPTIAVNSHAAKTLKNQDGTELTAGQLDRGRLTLVRFDFSNDDFRLEEYIKADSILAALAGLNTEQQQEASSNLGFAQGMWTPTLTAVGGTIVLNATISATNADTCYFQSNDLVIFSIKITVDNQTSANTGWNSSTVTTNPDDLTRYLEVTLPHTSGVGGLIAGVSVQTTVTNLHDNWFGQWGIFVSTDSKLRVIRTNAAGLNAGQSFDLIISGVYTIE